MSEGSPTPRAQPAYWCHQCEAEVAALMAPEPTCPMCHGQFVEEIEGSDANEFELLAEEYDNERLSDLPFSHPGRITRNQDLVQLFLQQLLGGRMDASFRQPGEQEDGGFSTDSGAGPPQGDANTNISTESGGNDNTRNPGAFPFNRASSPFGGAFSGGGGVTFEFSTIGAGGRPYVFRRTWGNTGDSSGGASNNVDEAEHVGSDNTSSGEQQGRHPLEAFFQLLGLAPHPNMNLGDYVGSQAALDNIVSRMMEQYNQENAPPPASEETIEHLPGRTITQADLDRSPECAICKDEFLLDDKTTQLPCHHEFHEECIKPWLKVNGTCPVCRYSLVQKAGHDDKDGSNSANASTSPFNAANSAQNQGSSGTSTTANSASQPREETLPGTFPEDLD
ncbi:hypothetical protein BZG36_01768 [Bifiguratus adelaidae]|uniref:RING-type E3 ubiquitin transferase n=1 Tax=Bifiguratus adelaidae TaxID=1938954 RepID=A0A261Y2W7_9FUNG|nr:hypothetical protein BZG36_01768 [Bifiguratus adelaidae]